ncbi:B subunit of glutamyl-tRNA amidotransferase [Endogone sp. FLAS-F59071]|nr:B subunit of glutamyl-tRNA amidotransferase [Endogone sp. FLAS-F59071]|eukprot:RUS23299.1 B subunit of glutamyl-tRNA amidotransferase [Endogone sp. FLAS-F59071]
MFFGNVSLVRASCRNRPLYTSSFRLADVTRTPNTSSLINGKWEAVVGLEIHAQINSLTKLFSGSPTSFNELVNTNVSVIDAAFPGVLPRLNAKCVDLAIKTSLALNADIHLRSSFDRKHYFYPDLPQGYQITQHYEPISTGGQIALTELDGAAQAIKVRIEQLQLEQDTGKSLHDLGPGRTLVDLNRAGTGLMEIVTMPDIRSSFEAGLVMRKLQTLLRCVGSSNGNMEEGSMRCDVNVSVHEVGTPFGTRCEIKNLNSVRFVTMAIDAEIRRHIEVLEQGGNIIQETRGYDVMANKTFWLRNKETAPDYRYMPEPDLPTLILSQSYVDSLRASLPELPDDRRVRIIHQYALNVHDANVLLGEAGGIEYFEAVCKGRDPRSVVNWMTHELFGQLAARAIPFHRCPVSPEQLGSLVDAVKGRLISGTIGKNVLAVMVDGDVRPAELIVEEKEWGVVGDADALRRVCEELVARNQDKVDIIRGGNPKLFIWFVGQAMRETKGRADPVLLNTVLEDVIGVGKDGNKMK